MGGDGAGRVPGLQKAEVRGDSCIGRKGRGAGQRGAHGPERTLADGTPFSGLCRMDKVGDALEEVLSKALSQRTITVGVYEAAKLLNV